ncbi:MAG: hypothetical protein KC418_05885 [Anaerolineales bacterium]|nr:hypothetical protein [Anaerolineales bacterium]
MSDFLAAFRWWLVLMMLGAAATPLAYVVLARLPDRGYAFVKMLGLLIISYIFWLFGSLGFLSNSTGSIILALLALAAISFGIYRRGDGGLRQWLRENRRQVLLTEVVFAATFALWVWVRAHHPSIAATEKPMEFAFLNSVNRSPSFPPLDPWLSNFAISYYYFGYVMTSVIARLAGVASPVAFNLGIAWLLAGTATGAFGLVYNLVRSEGGRRLAWALGLTAALALPIAGNMEILLETLHGNNLGSANFWQWLDVRDLNGPATNSPRYDSPAWWWWRSSRVINETRLTGEVEQGLEPIAEFPGFSFILGDMHPHVLALPFAFLSLAVALAWWLKLTEEENPPSPGLDAPTVWATARGEIQAVGAPLWGLTVLVLGGLSFLNTWDVLIHLFVVLGAYVLARWRRRGRWQGRLLAQGLLMGLMLAVPAILLYLPFYLGFRSQAGPPFLLPFLMQPTRLAQFLIIFLMPLFSITALLLVLAAQARLRGWKTGLISAGITITGLLLLLLLFIWLFGISPDGAGRLTNLGRDLNIPLLPLGADVTVGQRLSWGFSALFALLPAILSARVAVPWLTLFLAAVIGLVVMGLVNHQQPEKPTPTASRVLPFVLLLILTGALLTLGPEFVYLRDNFGQRLNTIFKFYYQAWVMFGVAALYAIATLLRRARVGGIVVTVGYGLLLAVALTFPYRAYLSRAAEYGSTPTLNGLAYKERFNPDEYEAIMWLRQNVQAMPTILEAVDGSYTEGGRISANTGLPTVLGWPGHEGQWRGNSTTEPSDRKPLVDQIYTDTNWPAAEALLNRYGVDYIYVGGLERSKYGEQGLDKFAHLEIAFQNSSVTIYRWQPQ